MGWADIESAIFTAVRHASGVEQVRLSTEQRQQDRRQRIEVSFELERIEPPEDVQVEVEGGLDLAQDVEVRVIATLAPVSHSHAPTLSAYAISYRLLRRSTLQATLDLLDAAGLVLERVGRAVPVAVEADQRALSALALVWVLRVRERELEGSAPEGLAPRAYFDRIEVTDDGTPLDRRALAPDLAPAALVDATDWRALWTGTQTDLVGGRRLVYLAGAVTHNAAAVVGSGVLDRATVLATTATSLACSDPDAGLLADGAALLLVLRAPAAAGLLASRSADGSAGWLLAARADGALELSAPAAALTLATDPGLLDGATWLLVSISLVAGTLSLEVLGEAPVTGACTVAQADDAAALLLNSASSAGAAGLELALLGEARTEDASGLLAEVGVALGL